MADSPAPSMLPLPSERLLRGRRREPSSWEVLSADDVNAFARRVLCSEAIPAEALPAEPRSARNFSWLHAAASCSAPAILQYLLSRRTSPHVDRRTGDSSTALLIAAEHRHRRSEDCDSVSALLRAGACGALARRDGVTAAHLACQARCTNCLRALLQREPRLVDATCKRRGERPLHVAARVGATECVAELCSNGAEVDARAADELRSTALHLACDIPTPFKPRGRAATVSLLLQRQANPNAVDARGRSPMGYAAQWGSSSTKIMRVLLSHGASPNCFSAAVSGALRAVEQRRAPARSSIAGRQGQTPSVQSTERRMARWARLLASLLRAGATVRVADLRDLQLGWAECSVVDKRQLHEDLKQGASAVPSLVSLSERALANSLTLETVLTVLSVASMLGTRRLQSECERMVLQHARALESEGAFSCCDDRTVLSRLMFNVLCRVVRGRNATAELDLFAEHCARCAALSLGKKQRRVPRADVSAPPHGSNCLDEDDDVDGNASSDSCSTSSDDDHEHHKFMPGQEE